MPVQCSDPVYIVQLDTEANPAVQRWSSTVALPMDVRCSCLFLLPFGTP